VDIIFLDHNATTIAKPEVVEAMLGAMQTPNNPSSAHKFGRYAKKLMNEARERVAKLADADGEIVVFVSSGTEANNIALKGIKDIKQVVISAVEHASVLKTAEVLEDYRISVDEQGVVRLDVLKKLLGNIEGKSLVSVMLANNETGTLQPIKEITEIVHEHGGIMHCDAAQAFGKIPVSFADLGVDMLTISSHKIGGPQGAGALIVKQGIEIDPLLTGGSQEGGLRAGTENVSAIVGFGVAAELAHDDVSSELRDYMEQSIKEYVPDVTIFGEGARRLPNTSSIGMPGMDSQKQLIAFDMEDIAVSSGSACGSGTVKISHVLQAMGIEVEKARTVLRVSIGADNTKEEIDRFIEVWMQLYDRVKNNNNAPDSIRAA